jgi:hypothetical protein
MGHPLLDGSKYISLMPEAGAVDGLANCAYLFLPYLVVMMIINSENIYVRETLMSRRPFIDDWA